jgi:hypothetical protein
MSGRKIAINTPAVSHASGTTLYLCTVKAPDAVGIVLTAMEVSFEGGGTASDRGVKVEYCIWTTDGTGTGSITVSNADRQDDGSPATTAQYGLFSVAPSGFEIVLRKVYVDTIKGNDSFPGAIRLKAGEVFGIRLTNTALTASINATAFIGGDE